MEFQQASIALLASMVLVLAGMVGWLYWQQTKIFQNMNNIVAVIGELAARPAQISFPEPVHEVEEIPAPAPESEDDRASVEDEGRPDVPVVEGPPDALDTDGLESKTKKELQDILTKRGLPFNRSDTKTSLISLLKATA
jgi:hypothetical protein